MEEEEEVDIVGGDDSFMSRNEREISYISSGQILSCDYTVHPQWLADNADATVHWSDNFPKQSSQDEMEMVQDEVVIEEPAPIDFDWCEETSNCGDIVLDQDIPATIEEEVVTNSGTEAEDEITYESPRSTVSIASPTLHSRNRNSSVSSNNPRSLLKRNFLAANLDRPPSKFRQTLMVNRSLLKGNLNKNDKIIEAAVASLTKTLPIVRQIDPPKINLPKTIELPPPKQPATVTEPIQKKVTPSTVYPAKLYATKVPTTIRTVPESAPNTSRSTKDAPKFRQTIKVSKSKVFQNKRMRQLSKQLQMRNQGTKKTKAPLVDEYFDEPPALRSGGKGKTGGKGKRGKKFINLHGENITINHDAESGSTLDPRKPVETPPLVDPRTIVRRAASISDEDDVDVDIESDGSESPPPPSPIRNTSKHPSRPVIVDLQPNRVQHFGQHSNHIEFKAPSKTKTAWTTDITTPPAPMPKISDELKAALNSMGVPDSEIEIDLGGISPLEKYFHYEFFEGRPTKTPDRFVKIRNFIIKTWHDAKPVYVSKTAVRHGLKQCGDVNCISRIHSLLEQMGAINFGCEQLSYIRPLRELSELFAQPNRGKITAPTGVTVLERRPRAKPVQHVEVPEVDANYTVSHEDGTIVLPRVKRLEDSSSDDEDDTRRRQKLVKPEFRLVECMRFNQRNRIAPFRVSITLSTLMCLQLHSLSARNEVMGFLGGHRERRAAVTTLRLNRYKPCETSAQSGTMCEMCPISQAEQSASLTENGYDLLGWFHSHPAFPPNPSMTDIATQADMQLQFDQDRPFVGFILGCVDMQYKCVYVLPEDVLNVTEHTIPYQLDVEIVQDCSNFTNEIADVFDVIKNNCDDYTAVLQKFTAHARGFLQRHGFGKDVLAGLNNIM